MSFGSKLLQAYFDYAYNPVYDSMTARLNRYRELQAICIGKLELEDKDKVLCVGVGTGNEIFHILQINRNVSIVGVDYSRTALRKAYKKASSLDKEIKCFVMNAQHLEFATGSFDKVLCIHVMDFVEDNGKATGEIFRVLKDGGQFVITYPLAKEGLRLGVNLLNDSVRHNISSGKHRIRAFLESFARMMMGVIYLPLLFRLGRKSYSRSKLEAVISHLNTVDFQIEEDSIYQDFIVCGRKISKGGKGNAS